MSLIFGSIIPVTIEAFALYFGIRSFIKYRLISKTRTKRVCNVEDGVIELKGRLVPLGPQLSSPLEAVPCLFYKLEIQKEKHFEESAGWETIAVDTNSTYVGLCDGTGVVEIDMLQSESDFMTDGVNDNGIFREPTQHVKDILIKNGKYDDGRVFNTPTRYLETLYREGDEVFVLGNAQKKADGKWLITKGENQFLISKSSEEKWLKTHLLVALSCAAIAAVCPILLIWIWKNLL